MAGITWRWCKRRCEKHCYLISSDSAGVGTSVIGAMSEAVVASETATGAYVSSIWSPDGRGWGEGFRTAAAGEVGGTSWIRRKKGDGFECVESLILFCELYESPG